MTGVDLFTLQLAKDYTDSKIVANQSFKIVIAANKASIASPQERTLYFIQNGKGIYEEYVYVGKDWYRITSVKLPDGCSMDDVKEYVQKYFEENKTDLTPVINELKNYVDEKFAAIDTEIMGVVNGEY